MAKLVSKPVYDEVKSGQARLESAIRNVDGQILELQLQIDGLVQSREDLQNRLLLYTDHLRGEVETYEEVHGRGSSKR